MSPDRGVFVRAWLKFPQPEEAAPGSQKETLPPTMSGPPPCAANDDRAMGRAAPTIILAYVQSRIDHSPLEPNPPMAEAHAKLPRAVKLNPHQPAPTEHVRTRFCSGSAWHGHFEAVFDTTHSSSIAAELEPKPAAAGAIKKFLVTQWRSTPGDRQWFRRILRGNLRPCPYNQLGK